MRKRIFSLGVMALLFAACSVNEMDIATPIAKDAEEFFATIEDASTRVFVDDDLMVLWHADDRVSIFNKYTYNQQYRFTGYTGANSGSFTKVPNDDFVTGNALNYVYAIYPYKESTVISNHGILTIDLPATQLYAENSFGVGANTMVSCSEGNELLFKNLCGYIMLKLYGDNVTVKSISIKGNNDEPLAGKAAVNASLDNAPTMSFDASATNEITLTFDSPVTLGTTSETATTFWLVVPPTTFSKGITVTVKDDKNGEFKKSTTASLQVSRNTLKRMSALQVVTESNIIFADENVKAKLVAAFDTNSDGELSNEEAAAVTSIEGVFGEEKNYLSFDEFQFFTNVTSIPDACFADWYKLKSITLPESIINIGAGAFAYCTNLESLYLPESITDIGSSAFLSCSNLVRINIPSRIKKIKTGVFRGTAIREISIPNSVNVIDDESFSFCQSLIGIRIPDSVTIIGFGAFEFCTSLLEAELPSTLQTINYDLFKECEHLERITIPESVTQIGNNAFEYCKQLKSIHIPNSVVSLGTLAFSGCHSLSTVVLSENLTSLPQLCFQWCDSLSAIELPSNITNLGHGVFAGCTNLSSVSFLGNSISIGISCFDNCASLKTMMLPKKVESIGQKAFWGCEGLESITIPSVTVPVGGNQMFEVTGNLLIYVPSESVDAYKTAQYWSDYADRIYAIGTPQAIDLGLPSGLKWASFNLGASKPEEYGDFYAWGEIETKEEYSWGTYKWCEGSENSLTKYCSKSSSGFNGFTDTKTVLDLEDDAAHITLGGRWRMPTSAECKELINNCSWTWTIRNGVNGYLVMGSNGNSLFLPATGGRLGVDLSHSGEIGSYWTNSFYSDTPNSGRVIWFRSGDSRDYDFCIGGIPRYVGLPIRPVSD